MKKLILVLMAMLMMVSIASATFDVFYKTTTSPYKMREYVGAERVTMNSDGIHDAEIHFITDCDVSDTTYAYDTDGRLPCVEIINPATANITVSGISPEVWTKQVFVATRELNSAPVVMFDVFYKSSESPYKMRAFSNAKKVSITGIEGNRAIASLSSFAECDASDAGIDPAVDSDGQIPCIDIRTDESARINVSSWATGESVLTKEVFIYMHAPAAPVEPPVTVTPICTDSDPTNDVHVVGTVSGIDATGAEYSWSDECNATGNFVIEGQCTGGLVEYNSVPCPTGEVCFLGRCITPLSGDKLRQKLWEDITARIRGIQLHLNNIEKKACGTGLPTGKAVAANNAVTVNSFSSLEAELAKIYAQQERIAKCKGLPATKYTKAASSESNVASLIALTTKQTFDLKKATLTAKGVKAKTSAEKTPATATKTPVTAATNAPAKKSVFSKLLGK